VTLAGREVDEVTRLSSVTTHGVLTGERVRDVPLGPSLFRADARVRLTLLVVLDVTILLLSILMSEQVVRVATPGGLHRVVMAGSGLLMLNLFGFYRVRHVYPFHQRVYELSKVVAFSLLMTSGLFFTMPFLAASRSLTWIVATASFLGLVVGRTLYHRLFPLQEGLRRLLIVGAGPAGQHALAEVHQNPSMGFQVVGFVDDSPGAREARDIGAPVLGTSAELLELVHAFRVDSLVLASGQEPTDQTIRAVGDCVEHGCEVMSVARLAERLNRRIPVRFIGGNWFIHELNEVNRQLYQTAKRTLDIALSLCGLLATALLFPIIALAIRLDSPGPVIYSQIRVGRLGKPFRIYKFRSMRQDAEASGAVWASVGDARVTPVGQFLRQTRLDELPQLFNVLIGEMSLVGPRPERPEFVSTLSEKVPHYSRRHMVVPGLTGWAQVSYPYGASVEDALEKLQYDFYYIKHRSLFLDAEILLRTVSTVIGKIGAR
jgi:exopolysaccharide biosynthesis polyprenyl glycosylphosphotransferase